MSVLAPTEIRVHARARMLALSYADGRHFELPAEYLRVHSPSAEVQGHGPGQEVLVKAKENVSISAVEPVGHYAVRVVFDDKHDSGLYTWKYLLELAESHTVRWARYLERLRAAGVQREG
jgi:DUF971 family protein